MPLPLITDVTDLEIRILEYLKEKRVPQLLSHLRDSVAPGRQESTVISIANLAEEGFVRITRHADGINKLVSLEPQGHALLSGVYAQCG